ncbi:hypothetical protein [Streptomyces olivaceiscleroticus]|uniref:Uncharacterized protein n=1 Tax=Streptomyces olivaceiscleroticus TaxID=68245 RepID=A0ABN0ZP77_9ACTN
MSTDSHRSNTYEVDDYVLYRDGNRFWANQPDHTFPCRVVKVWSTGHGLRYDLRRLSDWFPISKADPAYMRLLPAADAMRDIDVAALEESTALTPAAIAWVRQHYPHGLPEQLPAQP